MFYLIVGNLVSINSFIEIGSSFGWLAGRKARHLASYEKSTFHDINSLDFSWDNSIFTTLRHGPIQDVPNMFDAPAKNCFSATSIQA